MATSAAKSTASKSRNYYYEKDPITNPDGNGENLVWGGLGAAELGLNGRAMQADFENIMSQKDTEGNLLRDTTNTTGKRNDTLDIIFASPKSVSLLAFGGEGNEKLIDIHKEAVQKAMDYLEANHANIKKTVDSERILENQGNLTYAQALHSGARGDKLSDPHLHTHNIVSNMVKDNETGEYRALAMKPLMDNLKVADQIYKSEMAKALVKEGYALEDKKHGWDIKMDQKVIDTFSSRNKEITNQVIDKLSKDKEPSTVALAIADAYKSTTGKNAEGLSLENMINDAASAGNQRKFLDQVANNLGETLTDKDIYHAQHSFKAEKKDWKEADLKEAWEAKLQKEAGVRSFEDLDKEAKGDMQFRFSSEKEVLEKTMELLTQNEAVIEEKQLLKEAAEVATGQFSYMDLKAELDNVKKIGQKEDYELKRVDDTAFTTKAMHDLERENINMIKNAGQSEALLTHKQAKEALADFEAKNFKMKEGQYAAAYNALTTTDNVVVIQGVAGAGKTAALKAINHSLDYHEKQVDVTLLAPTNKAVGGAVEESKLENGKSFEGMTTAKYVSQNNKENTDTEATNVEGYKTVKQAEKGFEKEQKQADKQVTLTKNLDYGATKSTTKKDSEVFTKTGNSSFEKASKHIADFQKNKNENWQVTVKHKDGNGRTTTIKKGKDKGAKKIETWNTKKGIYRVDITHADGSRYKSETKSYGQIDRSSFGSVVGSSVGKMISSGSTKAVVNSHGEKSLEKSNTLLGMTLKTKEATSAKGLQQSKVAFDVLKVAKLEKNTIAKSSKNGFEKEITKTASALGFSASVKKEEAYNKNGELVGLKTTKEKSFLGYTFKKEVEVTSKEDLKALNGKADLKIELKKSENGKETNEKLEAKNVDADKAVSVAEENGKLQKTDKVVIVDEGSMVAAKDMNSMLKAREATGGKLFVQGDSEQLQSIGSGKAFDQLKDNAKTVEMPESVRQLNKSEKIIADNIRDAKTVDKAFKELKDSGKLHEIKDENARIEAIASAAVKKEELSGVKPNGENFTKVVDYKNNIALSNTNAENEKVNAAIRDKLHASGEINKNENVKATVLQTKNMSGVKQLKADNFEKGQIISTFEKGLGVKQGENYTVVGKDTKNNTLMLKSNKNEFRKIDLKQAAGKLQVAEKKEKEFTKGDIVVVTKTDKKEGLLNSDRGIVVDFDKDKKTIDVDFGKDKGVKTIDLSKGDKGLDHGYSVTNYKAQGISVDRVQSNINTEKTGTTLNATHVALTRQKVKSELYTDNASKAERMSKVKQEKTSSIDYAERKNEKAAAAKTEKLEVKEAKQEVKEAVKQAKAEAGDVKREGRKLNYKEVQEAVQKSTIERNEGKATGNEEQYRKGQESFMNNQVVARNGFDKKAVEDFADKAFVSEKMYAKDAAQFVENSEKHAEALKNVGILEDKGNGKLDFVDSKAKEILFDNADKGIDKIGEANAQAYKNEVVKTEEITENKSEVKHNEADNSVEKEASINTNEAKEIDSKDKIEAKESSNSEEKRNDSVPEENAEKQSEKQEISR